MRPSIALLGDVAVSPACLIEIARHPLLTAETAAVIDQLAPGRFVIGLGPGPSQRADSGLPPQRWGLPSARAVARLREYIQIVRLALTEDAVSYHGEFYAFTDVMMRVRPASPTHPHLARGRR